VQFELDTMYLNILVALEAWIFNNKRLSGSKKSKKPKYRWIDML